MIDRRLLYIFCLDGAHCPCGLVLDTTAVLFTELDTAVGAKTDDANEANGPDESDDDTGLGDSRVKSLSRDDEGGGANNGCGCRGQGCSIGGRSCGLFGEDSIDEGCFLGGEGCFDVLSTGGVFGGELDSWDQKRLQCGPG